MIKNLIIIAISVFLSVFLTIGIIYYQHEKILSYIVEATTIETKTLITKEMKDIDVKIKSFINEEIKSNTEIPIIKNTINKFKIPIKNPKE